MIFFTIRKILKKVKKPYTNLIEAKYTSSWKIYICVNRHRSYKQDAYVLI